MVVYKCIFTILFLHGDVDIRHKNNQFWSDLHFYIPTCKINVRRNSIAHVSVCIYIRFSSLRIKVQIIRNIYSSVLKLTSINNYE